MGRLSESFKKIFASRTGAKEIVPVSTKNANVIILKKKKNSAKKKKKSGNLMKRAQKKFERDPRNFFFCERNLCESKKSRTKFVI